MLTGEEGEINMDKKSRPPAIAAKSGAPETKAKRQEGSSGNRYNRYSKKRESPHARYDSPQSRKPVPQKSRAMDKRPRQRTCPHDSQQGSEVVENFGAEVGSALHSGSKKANLNHLLGFTFTPRDVVGGSSGAGRSSGRNWKGRNKWTPKRVRFNKEQYLQANCQFVVRDDADYSVHFVDPDVLVEWDLVEQVNIFSHEMPSCPICLYAPTAAKITRCGHIYCWSCVLHYLSLGEKSWRKCPICYESLHQKDLKSVKCMPSEHSAVNDKITMRLMKRVRGSTYAMTNSQWTERNGHPHGCYDNVETRYLKLLTVSKDQIMEIIQVEKSELERQLASEVQGSIEASYIEAAITLSKEREAAVMQRYASHKSVEEMVKKLDINEESAPQVEPLSSAPPLNQDVKSYASAFSDEEEEGVESTQATAGDQMDMSDHTDHSNTASDDAVDSSGRTRNSSCESADPSKECEPNAVDHQDTEGLSTVMAAEELEMPPEGATRIHLGVRTANVRSDVYYFYQAADGQNIFLNSLNARCLEREYGSLQNAPDLITAQIVELEDVSMNQDLRHRLKYLSHLPLTCEFQVAELALKPPVLSKETIRYFGEEIDRRRRTRQRKQREERKQLKEIREKADKMMGIYPSMRSSVESPRHFPNHTAESALSDQVSTTSAGSASTTSTPISTPVGSPPGALNPNATEFVPTSLGQDVCSRSAAQSCASTNLSFAQMLQAGKVKVPTQSVVGNKAAASGAGGTKSGVKGQDSEESDCEDRVPVPVYQESFGSAIQKALDDLATNPGGEAVVVEPAPSSGKKKKKVKKLLFTTTMSRSK